MIFNFDPPETGWSLTLMAWIIADPTAPTSPNALVLNTGSFVTPSAWRTLTGLVVGQSYPVWVSCNFDDVPTIQTLVRIIYRDGNSFDVYFRKNPAVTGWETRLLGTLIYDFADRRFQIIGLDSLIAAPRIDAIYIGEEPPPDFGDVVKRSRWLAHQRLVAVLKGINGVGGGYHHDLSGRVFTKYIRPVGSTHPALPYLCVPLVNTAPRVEHDNTHLKHTWTLPIMAFVAEPNVGAYDSDAIAALYHLGEDVYRAVMQDPTLNNTVAPISFVSGGVEEGGISPFDGLPYADAVIPIDLSIYLGLDVLGP